MTHQCITPVSDEQCVSLIGMAGAGKSTLGKLLARRLGYAHLDTDRLIEATCGMLLSDLLAAKGIEGFMAVEESVVAGLTVKRCVIATGGSVVYGASALERLKSLGPVIFLQIDLETFLDRVGDPGNRAFVMPCGKSLADVYAERQPLYEQVADLTVVSCGVAPGDCVETILREIKWRSQ